MRSLPPLSAVRVFEAAARHENFTAAAGELGMTQAAVSYQMKLLDPAGVVAVPARRPPGGADRTGATNGARGEPGV